MCSQPRHAQYYFHPLQITNIYPYPFYIVLIIHIYFHLVHYDLATIHVPPCCAFPSLGYTATLQFFHSTFLPVLHSGYNICLFSSSHIFSSTTVSFLPHFVHFTFVPLPAFPSPFLHFHVLRQSSYHIFLSCSLETNPCP